MKQTTYNTKQKAAIMNCISTVKDNHFTIDTLCKLLTESGQTVGRTTVYRTVEKLASEGALRKYAASSGESVCYQFVSDHIHCDKHFHLKCEKCGNLIHMDCGEMLSIAEHIKDHHGFCIDPLKTVLYGICEACATK